MTGVKPRCGEGVMALLENAWVKAVAREPWPPRHASPSVPAEETRFLMTVDGDSTQSASYPLVLFHT